MLLLAFVTTATVASAFQDSFASASAFNYPGTTQINGFSNTGASAEPGELAHTLLPGLSANRSLWANFTVAAPGYVSLSTGGSNFDTLLAVYTGTSVKALKRVAVDDDFAVGNATSQVTFLAKPGVIYRVAVDAKGAGGTGNVFVNGFTPLFARSWYASLLEVSTEGSGLLTVTTTTTGAVSGTLKQGTRSFPFTGVMAPTGRIVIYISRNTPEGAQPAILDVTQISGGGRLDGTIYADTEETDDSFSTFTISLLPAGKYTAASPCPRKGSYTFTTSAVTNFTGFSYATMTVSATGTVNVTGFTGDGAAFTLGGPVLDTGSTSTGIFRGRQIVGGTGHVTVSLFMDGSVFPASVTGAFRMRRGIKPGAVFLPGGVSMSSNVFGGIYTPPAANTRVNAIFDPSGNGVFAAVSSPGFVNQALNLAPSNTFTYTGANTPKLALTINKANGTLTGSVTIGGIKCTIKGVSVFSPSTGIQGFYGFATGPAANGTMSILPPST